MIHYQIYVYDSQLIKFYDRIHNIDGFYTDQEEALKDLVRAASFDPRQLVLSKLTDYNSEIIAFAMYGKVQYTFLRS